MTQTPSTAYGFEPLAEIVAIPGAAVQAAAVVALIVAYLVPQSQRETVDRITGDVYVAWKRKKSRDSKAFNK